MTEIKRRSRTLATKMAVTAALVVVPLVGAAAPAFADPGYHGGPGNGPGQYQGPGPGQGHPGPGPGQFQQPPPGFQPPPPGVWAPPPQQWHHKYWPPNNFRDDPRAPDYPLGGYPPPWWWQALQALGLA